MSTDPRTWVNEKQMVRAFSGADRQETVATGQVIAYQESPSVLIADGGNRIWWAAHLCEVVETEVEAAARRLRGDGFTSDKALTLSGEMAQDAVIVLRHVLNGGTL